MLTFTCDTCKTSYLVTLTDGINTYQHENKRYKLTTHDQDCEECLAQIKAAIAEKRKQITSKRAENHKM